MYIPKTKEQLFLEMQFFWGYADDFTRHDRFKNNEEAEIILYKALENVFGDKPEQHARLKKLADEAFAAKYADDIRAARDKFGIIIDECG